MAANVLVFKEMDQRRQIPNPRSMQQGWKRQGAVGNTLGRAPIGPELAFPGLSRAGTVKNFRVFQRHPEVSVLH